jgi:hypothetical protein
MTERTTPPLTFGEYVSPDLDNSVQVWLARRQVIEASKRVYPTFLETLSTDVLPIYCQLAKTGQLAKGRINFEKALWGKFPWESLTDDGGLKTALLNWARQFHAEAPWLMVGRSAHCGAGIVSPHGGIPSHGTTTMGVETVPQSAKPSNFSIRDGKYRLLRGQPMASGYVIASKKGSWSTRRRRADWLNHGA